MMHTRIAQVLNGPEPVMILPQSCTSENEKDNFLFYIKALCKKQKTRSFTDEMNDNFHFLCPAGLAILPNLFCYQWLEVYKYIKAIDISHLRHANCEILNPDKTLIQRRFCNYL